MSADDRVVGVRAYYDARGESEWHRLDNPYEGAVEQEMYRRALEGLIPSGARVLDVGGGPGRWTIWLLQRGHQVVLGDLSPGMLDIARRELDRAGLQAEGILEIDARDLGVLPDGAFDVVLSLGPFYHLVEEVDRQLALAEARRVLRPGGLLVATVMTRYPWSVGAIMEGGAERIAAARRALDTGVYQDPQPGRLTDAYLFRVEDVRPFFETAGFSTRRLMAAQGLLHLVQEQVAELRERDPAAYEALLDITYRSSTDRSLLGASNHLLYAGERL